MPIMNQTLNTIIYINTMYIVKVKINEGTLIIPI